MDGAEAQAIAAGLEAVGAQLAAGFALGDKLDKLLVAQTALNATVTQITQRHSDEIVIIFQKIEQVDGRVRAVELDYVPRKRCAERMGESRRDNREEHETFDERLDKHAQKLEDQGTFGGKLTGAAIVAALLVGAFITWLLERYGGD